jgi:hypothetical protein
MNKKRLLKLYWKYEKILLIIIFPPVILYILIILFFPNILFENSIKYNQYTVYFNGNLDEDKIISNMKITDNKLQKSYFYEKHIESDIYFCNSKFLFAFLSPMNHTGFASNLSFNRKISISNVDLSNNSVVNLYNDKRILDLPSLLAHEINHGLVNVKLKEFDNPQFSEWKNEGFSEYIAFDKNINLQLEYQDTLNSEYWYIKNKCRVYYLLDIQKIKIVDFINNEYNLDSLDIVIYNYLKTNK